MTINILSRYFLQEHPRESARILEKYTAEMLSQYFEELPDDLVAGLIHHLSPDLALSCLTELPTERSAKILVHLGVDDAGRILSRMKLNPKNTILSHMPATVSRRLKLILKYPVGTVGHYMSPDIFIATEDMLIGDLIRLAKSAESELLDKIFIVDHQQILVGVIDVKNMMLTDADKMVQQIMKVPDTVLNVRTNLEYVKSNPNWQFEEFLPVVDQKNTLIGVLKRSIMNEVLSDEQDQKINESGILETVFDVADLFWEVCSNFINPNSESNHKAKNYDRSDT